MQRLLFIASILLAACSVARPAQAQASDTVPVLRPGDALRISVWRQPELSGEFVVLESGRINHPLFHSIQVADAPIPIIRMRVRDFLTQFETDPQFVIEPLVRIAVGGDVRIPSLYRLSPSTTIAQAIAQAGGTTERAKIESVQLTRRSGTLVADLRLPETGVAAETVRSGDYIFVPRSRSIYREYVVPTASVTAALAALINIFIRL